MSKIILLAIILPAICLGGIFAGLNTPKGDTLESREAILRELPKGIQWNIASEIELGDCIVSAITSSQKDGLAIFESKQNGGYECLSTSYRDKGQIVTDALYTADRGYRICWLNRAELDYVEITIGTMAASETIRIGVQDLLPVYVDVPNVDHTINISYYTMDGTRID